MTCPLCGTRKARRACPAVGRDICPVCCGTKRVVEIACPAACGYLATARAHPAAAVTRQRERDFRFALPLVHQLPEGAYQVLMVLQRVVRRHRRDALPALVDATVAEAAAALAATLETAGRGIIYEHQAPGLPAQRLLGDLRSTLDAVVREAGPAMERHVATALRRLEQGARTAREALADGPLTGVEYLDFLDRLPAELASAAEGTGSGAQAVTAETAPRPSRLILP